MVTTLARMLITLLVIASFPLPACAEAMTLDVPFAAEAPTIDGDIDQVWGIAEPQRVDKVVFGYRKNESDVTGTFQMIYDNENLYALFLVRDSERQNDSWESFDDDGVEIYLDGGNEKSSYYYDSNDCQYVFGAADKETWTTEGTGAHKGVAFATKETDDGYRIEIKIPWKDAKVKAAAGVKVGVDVHIDDDDDGWEMDCALGWSTSIPDSWTDPSLFGTMVLGSAAAEKEKPTIEEEKPTIEEEKPTIEEEKPTIEEEKPTLEKDAKKPANEEAKKPAATEPVVARAARAPKIDGEADEVWAAAVSHQIGNVVFGYRKNASDVSGSFQTLYDAENLYLLFTISDSERQNDSWESFDDDAVDVYLDGGHERTSYYYDSNDCQYTFGVGDEKPWTTEGTGDHAGVVFASKETDDGYRVEIKIPWEDVGVKKAERGTKVGLDVHIDDDDDGWEMDCAMGWSTSIPDSWTDPSLFATVVLGK